MNLEKNRYLLVKNKDMGDSFTAETLVYGLCESDIAQLPRFKEYFFLNLTVHRLSKNCCKINASAFEVINLLAKLDYSVICCSNSQEGHDTFTVWTLEKKPEVEEVNDKTKPHKPSCCCCCRCCTIL